MLTVISANSGAFSRFVCARLRIDDDHIGRCRLRVLAAARQLLQVDGRFRNRDLAGERHALRGAHEIQIGRDDDARAGNVRRQHALAADVHVDLARAIGLAGEGSRPSPETMPPSTAISPDGAGRACSCPFFSLQADRGNVRGELGGADEPGQLGRLHGAGDCDVGVDAAVHVRELRHEHGQRREIRNLSAHAAGDRRLCAAEIMNAGLAVQRRVRLELRIERGARVRARQRRGDRKPR